MQSRWRWLISSAFDGSCPKAPVVTCNCFIRHTEPVLTSSIPLSCAGLPCSCHRLFLAALILSAKYINDKTYKNRSWVSFSEGLFPASEINLMERQFLSIIDFDLHCHEVDHNQVLNAINTQDSKIKGMLFNSLQHPQRSDSATSFEPHSPPDFSTKPCPGLSQGFLPSPVTPSPLPLSMMAHASRFQPYALSAQGKKLVTPSVSPSVPL
ncbi:hypothetical protein BJ741DRAFT_590041 [Chytriomyces cf. hyalinus JEL632]|nr:hypothetical protein BJ741DRAFT_590041 [Chytriomyces cf. hyalinus JEL632]